LVEEEREDEEEEEDNEGRGKRVVKTSSVLRIGRMCLIAVRGSLRNGETGLEACTAGKR